MHTIYIPNSFFINSIYMNRCCVFLGPATTATISYTKNLRLVAQLTQEAVQKSSTGMEAVPSGGNVGKPPKFWWDVE